MLKVKFPLKKAVAAVLVIAVILLTSCGVKTEKIADCSVREYVSGDAKYRSVTRRGSVKAGANDSAELYFDPDNGNISFYDRLSGDSWNSLPSFSNDFATNMVIKVLSGDTLYKLDFVSSISNKDSIAYEETDSGVRVTYTFRAEDISVSLPVEYILDGAFFKTVIDTAQIVCSEGASIVSVEFMPYMGAVRYSADSYNVNSFGDWFLVPDGPGGLLYTAVDDVNTQSLLFSVYGNPYYENAIDASIGAYAVKQGDALLSAVVTEGEENTLIRVYRACADSKNINRIYPEFIITPISGEKGTVSVGTPYTGKFTVVYETLESESADYIGAAISVRQILRSSGILSDYRNTDEYPLFVSLIGSTDGKKGTVSTSFSQAENLLTILKGKGINEINLILEGMFSGGLQQEKASSVSIPSAIGGQDEFEELCAYATSQKLNVFSGINLFSSSFAASSSKNISGSSSVFSVSNPLAPYIGESEYEMYHLSADDIEGNVSGFINRFGKTGGQGVCILDTCKVLGDYSSGYNAADVSALYEGGVSAVSVSSDVMLASSDMHTLTYADYIKDVSFYTSIPESGSYVAVPFIPAVLHSSVVYSGGAVNLGVAPILELLKSVEYGAVPYYVWCFNESSDKYYESALGDAVDFYLEARDELGDLTSRRITEHFMYADGVYCTGYEGGVRVYVNYNNYSVVIGDVAVLPYDYLRIG